MVCPLTDPEPDFRTPKRLSAASEPVRVHFKEMVDPKGLGMDWAWLGVKSKLKNPLGTVLKFLASTEAKLQSAWTVEAPLFVMDNSLPADATKLTTSPL